MYQLKEEITLYSFESYQKNRSFEEKKEKKKKPKYKMGDLISY